MQLVMHSVFLKAFAEIGLTGAKLTKVKSAVPILAAIGFAALGLTLSHIYGPHYGADRSDPAYCYLFNGLGLLQGHRPSHTDHPGTTVQELAAIVILIKWLVSHLYGITQPVSESVIRRPEDYLQAINRALLGIDALAIAFGVAYFIKRTGRAALGLLVPALIFCSISNLQSLADVEPETLLIGLTVLVVTLAWPQTHASLPAKLTQSMLLGAAIGAGIVTKVTFLPLALFILALMDMRAIVVAAVSVVVSVAILTVPIWPKLGAMASWYWRLLTHRGLYGDGPRGLPSMHVLMDNASTLHEAEPLLIFGIVLLAVVAAIGSRAADEQSHSRLFLIGAVVGIVQLIITLPRPAAHYLVPSLVSMAVLIPLALNRLIEIMPRFRVAVASAAIVLLVFFGNQAVAQMNGDVLTSNRREIAFRQLIIKSERLACRLLPYYRFSSPEYAMLFGDDFAGRVYSKELSQAYPNFLSFNVWAERLENFRGNYEISDEKPLLEKGPLCLIGEGRLDMLVKTKITLLEKDGDVFVYRILDLN